MAHISTFDRTDVVISNAALSTSVWDLESTLNLSKQDDSSFFIKANAASYRSENSELSSASHTSGEDPVSPPSNDTL